ncbi:hypothetical protein ACPZ19_02965 [Amycolatopsis lurida]
MIRMRWIVVGAAVLAAGALGWVLFAPPGPPEVDPELERAALPAIDAALEAPGWTCTQDVIEIRPDAGELRVGLLADCDRAEPRSGFRGPRVFTLAPSPDGYTVLNQESPGDGAAFAPTVEQLFSPEGAAEVFRLIRG